MNPNWTTWTDDELRQLNDALIESGIGMLVSQETWEWMKHQCKEKSE